MPVLYINKINKESCKSERKGISMKEYSIWVNKKDKTESYVLNNEFTEKDYKKGDTIVYMPWFEGSRQEIYLHDDLELALEFNDEDIIINDRLDYFHNGVVNHENFYFDKPNHHAVVLLLKNGLYVLVTFKDRDRIHHGQVFGDKDALKLEIAEMIDSQVC